MKKIALISDTHSYLNPKLLNVLSSVDEIWHAGDIGNIETLNTLKKIKNTIAVYGNIDNNEIKNFTQLTALFFCEEVKIIMTHIGGYPKKYSKGIKELLIKEKPNIFISGHSHILKIIYDKELDLLHLNPGAAGFSGFHSKITYLTFTIDKNNIKDMKIHELPKYTRI